MLLQTALQEWQLVCQTLGEGACSVLLRKGGIHDRGGVFELEHRSFALLPSHLHQDPARLRYPSSLVQEQQPGRPAIHRLALWAEVQDVWQIKDLELILSTARQLNWPWSDAEIEKRFLYRDQPFLYIVLLRCFRLEQMISLPDHPSYAGCKSWIPLQQPIDCQASHAVLEDEAWQEQALAVRQALNNKGNA